MKEIAEGTLTKVGSTMNGVSHYESETGEVDVTISGLFAFHPEKITVRITPKDDT